MTTTPDLPVGTRCMVDVAAMERDGPLPSQCGCPNDRRAVAFSRKLRLLAEQIVVVAGRRRIVFGCCQLPSTAPCDEVSVDAYTGQLGTIRTKGFSLPRKYLVPLPEGEDEMEAP